MGEAIDPGTVEALYAEPPDRFIAARKELAGRLKEAGDADGAAAVAALRKPTVAAWAVDRLARDHRADLDALIEASAERRRLVERLVRAAATSLESGGMSAARASLDKVSDTLLAIATDEEAAERVRRGVLDKELAAPAGFGDQTLDASLLASVTELPRRADRDEARPTVGERRQAEARRKADRLADEAGRLEDEADELDRAAIDAEKQAATSRRAADAARKKAETARRRADDAAKRV